MLQQPRFKRLDPEAELCPVTPVLPYSLPLREAVERAAAALLADQKADGHWVYELEADCTIPAEYILMMHFIGEIDTTLQARIARYLRQHQAAHGLRLTDLHVWRVGRGAWACALTLEVGHSPSLHADAVRQWLSVHEEIVHVTIELQRG